MHKLLINKFIDKTSFGSWFAIKVTIMYTNINKISLDIILLGTVLHARLTRCYTNSALFGSGLYLQVAHPSNPYKRLTRDR